METQNRQKWSNKLAGLVAVEVDRFLKRVNP